jgi:hypothetical protein
MMVEIEGIPPDLFAGLATSSPEKTNPYRVHKKDWRGLRFQSGLGHLKAMLSSLIELLEPGSNRL